MRTRLVRFSVRFVITSFILGGGLLSAFAHDLPNFSANENVVDCIGHEGCPYLIPKARKATEPTRGPRVDSLTATPTSAVSMAMAYSRLAFEQKNIGRQLTSQLNALVSLFSDRAASEPIRFAAFPDAAEPPAPRGKALGSDSVEQNLAGRSIAKRNFVEDYMPYDFCVRDWRFGQYSYRGLSRIAHLDLRSAEITDESQLAMAIIAEPEQPSEAAIELGNFLHKLADWQCTLYSEFTQLRSLEKFASQTAVVYLAANARFPVHTIEVVEPAPAIQPQPYYTQPLYVIYELADKQFLLPVDQLRQWSAAVDSLQPAAALPSPVPARESFSNKVVDLAQAQLQNLGNEFQRLWSKLDHVDALDIQPAVASREQTEVR